MSLNNKIKQQGFTIVELLIVIVVIGILAAITIVAYNGVQSRAKTSSAQAAAVNVEKKAELYNSDDSTSGYPLTGAALAATASSTLPYYIPAGSVTFTTAATAMTAAPSSPSTLDFYQCGATAGNKIGYWNYTTSAVNYMYTGSINSTTPAASCTKTTT